MYQHEDLLPTNRNYILLLGCFTFIFTIGLIYFAIVLTRTKEEIPTYVKKEKTTIPSADLTRYNQDSDGDLIPNFVEEEAILNTYISETNYCEAANPLCSEKTFRGGNNITLILDSSTSMDIPAQDGRSKLKNVKDNIATFISDTINEKYIKTQVIGFGNKGSEAFIADNESCVANLTFKKFDQDLISGDYAQQVLDKYVPNGKSPLAYTIEQAEKTFKDKNANNLIYIVTDGTDDCGGDLANTFRQVYARGMVKQINVFSYYAPQDERSKLKEITESNGGKFSDSGSIFATLVSWKKDFLLADWCKYKDQNKIFQCLDKNYKTAYTFLDTMISTSTPQNEINKIREIKSSGDLLIQNYQNSKNKALKQEFEEFYNKARQGIN